MCHSTYKLVSVSASPVQWATKCLEEHVQEHLCRGWQLAGSMAMAIWREAVVLIQPMIYVEDPLPVKEDEVRDCEEMVIAP